MKTKYHDLYHKHLVEGKDQAIMKLWGEVDKWEFNWLAENKPDIAEMFLEHRLGAIEASRWNNYLTEKEAEKIMASMNPAAKWSVAEIKSACAQLGVPDEEAPYFNCYALAVVMNSLMSDHKASLMETFTDKTALVTFVYKQAVEKLKDIDRTHYVRTYYSAHL